MVHAVGEYGHALKRQALLGVCMLEDFADLICGGTLGGNAPYASDHGAELSRRDILAEIGSRSLRYTLLHQRAAKIVGPRLETIQGLLETKLDPGDLNVGDIAVQKHAGERMNNQI